MKRALVTGGAGFVGSHLVETLAWAGWDVFTFDSYVAGSAENLAGVPGCVQIQGDVVDAECVEGAIRSSRPDVIFHLACSKKNVSLDDPQRDLAVNAGGTLNVLQAARKHKVARFVHVSTGSVYGEPQVNPQQEDHPLCPVSFYGVSKLAGERYAHAFRKLYGLDTVILRYFHVYGPRQPDDDKLGGVVAIFCRRAVQGLPLIVHGDGQQVRSFTYVGDVARATLHVAQLDEGGVFNVASGTRTTVLDLAISIMALSATATVEHGQPLPGDIRRFDVSNRKLAQWGFSGWTSLDEGLVKTYHWYKRKYGTRERKGTGRWMW